MKNILIALPLFLALLLIGCQENPITEPVSSLEKADNPTTTETIQLHFVIEDPVNGSVELVGEVNYQHDLQNSYQQIYDQNLVSVDIEFNSTLSDVLGGVHLGWNSTGKSEDDIYVSEEGIYVMQKSYNITNREDVVLVVQYLITTEGVGVPNVWITQID
jgi:hypothetical protein